MTEQSPSDRLNRASNEIFEATSFLNGTNAAYIEQMYAAWIANPTAVDQGWQDYFSQVGDQGLDQTHTWGRTYWGGAGFCLLADVELRKQTRNRFGLQQALRAVLAAGGNISKNWDILPTLQTADKATGTHVLTTLYKSMADKPVSIDFNSLWQQLGVASINGAVAYNPKAPLAAIREAIFTPIA